MKQIIGSLLIIFVVGCNEGFKDIPFKKENSTIFEERYILEESDSFKVVLDEETGFFHFSMGFDSISNREYFSFLNGGNNALYIYDSETSTLTNKVKLEYDGPNGFGGLQMASHLLISLDSILIYNYSNGLLHLTNTDGEVYWKENLSGLSTALSPEPSQGAPLLKIGNDIFIACSINRRMTDYSETPIVLKYNIKTRNAEHLYRLSEVYNSGFWGDIFKYVPGIVFNNKTQKLVLNFPVDPELHVVSLDGKEIQRYYESSKYINSMPPFREDISYGTSKDRIVRNVKEKEYTRSTPDFSRIIYDRYRNVYYRIAVLRPSIDLLRAGKRTIDFSVSILDENFVKVGERKFDGDIYARYILLNSKGLNIARMDLYYNNEDMLTYSVFTLNDKKASTD